MSTRRVVSNDVEVVQLSEFIEDYSAIVSRIRHGKIYILCADNRSNWRWVNITDQWIDDTVHKDRESAMEQSIKDEYFVYISDVAGSQNKRIKTLLSELFKR